MIHARYMDLSVGYLRGASVPVARFGRLQEEHDVEQLPGMP